MDVIFGNSSLLVYIKFLFCPLKVLPSIRFYFYFLNKQNDYEFHKLLYL